MESKRHNKLLKLALARLQGQLEQHENREKEKQKQQVDDSNTFMTALQQENLNK